MHAHIYTLYGNVSLADRDQTASKTQKDEPSTPFGQTARLFF